MYPWLSGLLNTYYRKRMPIAKYDSLFTSNAQTELKANVLMIINEWILDEVKMECDHGAGSDEARTKKELVKIENHHLLEYILMIILNNLKRKMI